MDWLSVCHGAQVRVVLSDEGTARTGECLWVIAEARTAGVSPLTAPRHSVRSIWPTTQHKTMVGLMYRLVHQLDHALDAEARALAEGLPF